MRILPTASLLLCGCLSQVIGDPPPPLSTGNECHSTFGLSQEVPDGPPPVAGGTLLVLPDGTAVASDPDTDRIWISKLQGTDPRSVVLQPHDEPGRLAVDGSGKVHVVLRRRGAVATIDPISATLIASDDVCPAPRGIAYDATRDQLHVACVGGELVSLPAAGGPPVRTLHLVNDLRDVVAVNGTIHVSRFRSAELLTLAADGRVIHRTTPQPFFEFAPSVAWRTISTPSGSIAMLHQRSTTATLDVSTIPDPSAVSGVPGPPGGGGGYGSVGASNCSPGGSVVQSALSVLTSTQANLPPGPFPDLTLPVDVAVTPDGKHVAVVSAAVPGLNTQFGPRVVILTTASLTSPDPKCTDGTGVFLPAQAIAVAALANDRFVVAMRNPAMLSIVDLSGNISSSETLGTTSNVTSGHDLFHTNSGANIACASCHPEGGDDGRVWQFTIGLRRTMPLRGGLRGTEPFHWSGDERSFTALMADVFDGRMHGAPESCENVQALANWMESIPVLKASIADPAAVARGDALFHAPSTGCASCHSGDHFTNNQNADVGTGEMLQVPRLTGLGFRAPYLHDGRAATLKDRFTAIGGGDQHGYTSDLSASQVDDLVAFLSTL